MADYTPVTATTANSTAGAKDLAKKIEANIVSWVKGELGGQAPLIAAIDRLTDAIKAGQAPAPADPPVDPPDDTPPTPPVVDPAPSGDGILASADFEDGTAGPFGGLGGEIKIVLDPTNSGKGKVLSLDYVGPGSINRQINLTRKLRLGETLFFRGELFIDAPSLKPPAGFVQRKLLYWRADGGPLFNWMYGVLKMNDAGLAIEAGAVGPNGIAYSGGDAGILQPRKWHTVEMQTTMPTVAGKPDGILRLWIDNALRLDVPNWNITHASWIGARGPSAGSGAGGVMTPADIFFNIYMVGDQLQTDQPFAEKRYWNNPTFSTKRIAA